MTRMWIFVVVAAAAAAASACAVQRENDEHVSIASEELSVFDWSADGYMPIRSFSSSEPAVAPAGAQALSVFPHGYSSHYRYLWWSTTSTYSWSATPVEMSPRATTTAKPTLVAFNGFDYVFYASNVDQYMARFNPATRTWTGSTRLPFDSLGAVAAIAYNGGLALVRANPANNQLFLRFMASDESFSPEQAISYSAFATDPCQPPIVVGVATATVTATASAERAAEQNAVVIGFFSNEFATSTVALATVGDCLYLAHRDNTSNTLVYNTYKGGAWGPKRTITSGAGGAAQLAAAQPAMAAYAGGLHLVHVGPGSTYDNLYWSTLSNGIWSAPLSIPNHVTQGTPSMAAIGNRLMLLHQGGTVTFNNGDKSNMWSSTYLPAL